MFKWLRSLFVAEPTGERAKDDKGRFVADDPSTPNVNEAYVDGKTPTPRDKPVRKRKTTPRKKKTTAKKRAPRKKKVDA